MLVRRMLFVTAMVFLVNHEAKAGLFVIPDLGLGEMQFFILGQATSIDDIGGLSSIVVEPTFQVDADETLFGQVEIEDPLTSFFNRWQNLLGGSCKRIHT